MTPKYYKIYAGLVEPFYPRIEYQDRLKFNCREDAENWAEKRAKYLFDLATGSDDGPYMYEEIVADAESFGDNGDEVWEEYIEECIEYRVQEDEV